MLNSAYEKPYCNSAHHCCMSIITVIILAARLTKAAARHSLPALEKLVANWTSHNWTVHESSGKGLVTSLY